MRQHLFFELFLADVVKDADRNAQYNQDRNNVYGKTVGVLIKEYNTADQTQNNDETICRH